MRFFSVHLPIVVEDDADVAAAIRQQKNFIYIYYLDDQQKKRTYIGNMFSNDKKNNENK